jgi:hypothetical protein
MTLKPYTLPAKFTNDWFNRCMGDLNPDMTPEQAQARSVREGKNTVIILLTDAESADLLADAKHYADMSDDYWDEGLRPLCRSAARVVARLTK